MSKYSAAWFIRLLPAILALAILTPVLAWANDRSDAVWQAFRRQNPFHAQIVGLTAADGMDNERVLVISEPSPLLPRQSYREALAAIFGPKLTEAMLRQHQIGYDGWVEDVVARIAYPATPAGDHALADDMTRLAQHLFGTAYKFAPIRLEDPNANFRRTPSGIILNSRIGKLSRDPRWNLSPLRFAPLPVEPASGPALAPPGLDVTAAELKTWLLDSGRKVKALDTGAEATLNDLLNGGEPGVYLSPERGLVILLLSRDPKLNVYRAAIRKFALDTDAIVGAIASGISRVAVIGRERDTTLAAMPPLRSETVLMLAATRSDRQLAQSYERNSVFAGKLRDGDEIGRDWAPIYLSKDLYNTEFGSLLNITDQLLKSWSMSNLIKYDNFTYPDPATLPFNKPLIELLNANSVTFNWNTVGVGSVSAVDGFRIFALNRTGSLPVSYCPEENCTADKSAAVVAAEERAYNWFSGLRDPNLARAVEYTALYQIFRAFTVPAEADEPPPENYRVASDYLVHQSERLLGRLMSLAASGQLNDNAFARAGAELNTAQDKCGPAAIHLLAIVLADRNNEAADDPVECSRGMETPLSKVEDDVHKALHGLPGVDGARLDVVNAARAIETGYIKTPSIVLSWPVGFEAVGGHNLYSRTTQIETSAAIPRGQVRIDTTGDSRVLMINPDDTAHSSALARAYERNATRPASEVTNVLQRELAAVRPIRTMPEGLRLSEIALSARRGLTAAAEGDPAIGEIGIFPTESPADVVARFQQIAAENQYDIMLTREAEGYIVIRFQPKPANSMRAPTEPAMLEALGQMSGQAARLRLPSGLPPIKIGVARGYSEGELRAVIQTEQIRTAAGGNGGWKPPGPPHDFTGLPPEPDRLNGFFYRAEETGGPGNGGPGNGGGPGGGGTDGYSGFGPDGEDVQLTLIAKDAAVWHDMMVKPVNWAKAKIRAIDHVPVSGELASMHQIGFEIELPLQNLPVLEWARIRKPQPFYMRIVAFFRRTPTAEDVVKSEKLVTDVLQQNAKDGVLPIDGVTRLKHEIMQSLAPDDLRFYNTYSSRDVMIVRLDTNEGRG